MHDRVRLNRKKANTSIGSNPLLVSSAQSTSVNLSTHTASSSHDLSRIAPRYQAKLSISQPGDTYEQEADKVAQQVMGMEDRSLQQEPTSQSEHNLQRKPVGAFITPLLQRAEIPGEEEEETLQMKPVGNFAIQREEIPDQEEETLQMKSIGNFAIQREEMPEEEEELVQAKSSLQRAGDGGLTASNDISSKLHSRRGGGSPLGENVRSFMEPRFGVDFSNVKVHTDGEAVQMARDVGAQAFAYGSDVYFGAGKAPGKDALTAHELTHVVQQTGGVQTKPLIMRQDASTPTNAPVPSAKPADSTSEAFKKILETHAFWMKLMLEDFKKLDKNLLGEMQKIVDTVPGIYHERSRIAIEAALMVEFSAASIEWLKTNIKPDGKIDQVAEVRDFMGVDAFDKSSNSLLAKQNLIKEQEFAERGATALAALENGVQATGSGGDGVVSKVPGFPDWFENIQDTLIRSTAWGDPQESAQNLLHDYSVWNLSGKQGSNKHLHPSLERFFRYLGRSAANKKTNAAYKKNGASTPNAGELGAEGGSPWCASATNSIFVEALKEKDLWVKTPSRMVNQAWFDNAKLQVGQPQVHTIELRPGDQVSFVDQNTPASGHVATIVEANGDTFTTVSGNAGGVTGGSVRMGQVTRETPPSNYDYWEAIKSKNPTYEGRPKRPSKPGIVWMLSLVRYSSIDPSQIDPNDAATLKKYGLEHINPVKK